MNTPIATRRALQVFELRADRVYTIETAAQFGHVSRRRIILYCKHGLLSPMADPRANGFFFDARAIRTLRHIEQLRTVCGNDLVGIGMILKMANEIEQLHKEIRLLREQHLDYFAV